jgi:hypothetical protein
MKRLVEINHKNLGTSDKFHKTPKTQSVLSTPSAPISYNTITTVLPGLPLALLTATMWYFNPLLLSYSANVPLSIIIGRVPWTPSLWAAITCSPLISIKFYSFSQEWPSMRAKPGFFENLQAKKRKIQLLQMTLQR